MWLRLGSLLKRKQLDGDLDDEFAFHLSKREEQNRAAGLPIVEARYTANRQFGNATIAKETARDLWTFPGLENLSQDLRFASRGLRKNPGFALVAILTLALGIGATTAIFSVMNAVLFRYLPVSDPQRLVFIHWASQPSGTSQTGNGDLSLSEPVFEELRSHHDVFSSVIAFVPLNGRSSPVRISESPEEASVDMVSGDFFSGLGVQPSRGRILNLEDEQQHTRVAILSYNYWTRRFARNPSTLGQSIYIKGFPFVIAGIAASDFAGVEQAGATDIWIPFQNAPELKPWGVSQHDPNALYGSPNWWFLMVIGRLAPGVSAENSLVKLQPAYERAARASSTASREEQTPGPLKLYYTSVRGIESMRRSFETPLKLLMIMVALVLTISCSNVGMLFVTRNSSRSREFSLRSALGATGNRLFSQLLAESFIVVAIASFAGWVFAVWSTQALARWAQLTADVSPDRTVLFFTLGVSALAAIIFGLSPLRGAVRNPPGLAGKSSASSAGQTVGKLRASQAVIVFQMAFCLTLLVGAGLLVRTLRNLESASVGMRADGLVTFGITPPASAATDGQIIIFFQSLLQRLRTLPNIESATLLQNRPGSGWSNNTVVFVNGVMPHQTVRDSLIRWNAVGPDCFHVLGTPILLGRDFTDADSSQSLKVAIVNETFVQNFLGGSNPIGQHIAIDDATTPQYTVVGVAKNSKYTSVRERDFPMAYLPYTQVPDIATMQIELHFTGSSAAAISGAQSVVREFGSDLPLQQPMTQQSQFEASFSEVSLFMRLAVFFGLLAGFLVATGLYGTLAYRVNRRTAEIGVRMALGAQSAQVLWMVLRETLLVSAAGAILGVPLALAGTKLLGTTLFGLAPHDPWVFSSAIAGIFLVAILAAWLPARRAMLTDPLVALRHE
jgi:predicted permease